MQQPLAEEPAPIVVQHAGQLRLAQILVIKWPDVLPADHVIVQIQHPVGDFRDFVSEQPQHTAGGEAGVHIAQGKLLPEELGDIDFLHRSAIGGGEMVQIVDAPVGHRQAADGTGGEIHGQDIDLQRLCRMLQQGENGDHQSVFDISVAAVQNIHSMESPFF